MIDELPDAPDPATDAPTVFNAKAAAFVLAQKAMVPQINAGIAAMSSFAAGGAYSFQYVFDSATSDADPGPGKLRLSSSTQNAATTLRIDALTVGGVNIDGLLAALGAGTSVLKGAIRIVEVGAPGNWMLFDIMAVASATGYRNLTVMHRAGSSASPFSNGDPVMIYLDRAGDVGNGAEVLLGGADITEPTALINFLNIFSSLYDTYRIELNGVTVSAAVGIQMRVANAGSVVSTAGSYTSPVSGGTNTTAVAAQWYVGNFTTIRPRTLDIELQNVNSVTPKVYSCDGAYQYDPNSVVTYLGVSDRAMYLGSHALSGFQLSLTGAGNFTGGKVRIYGRRN